MEVKELPTGRVGTTDVPWSLAVDQGLLKQWNTDHLRMVLQAEDQPGKLQTQDSDTDNTLPGGH